jgi:hypothetical protein
VDVLLRRGLQLPRRAAARGVTNPKTGPVNRIVAPEILDHLPPSSPAAIRSRRDLRRLNALMGHAKICAAALRPPFLSHAPRRWVDLGAGDGAFVLQVARLARWPKDGGVLHLVDRLNGVAPETIHELEALGWEVRGENSDVFEWLRSTQGPTADLITANLFLHHFQNDSLAQLLRLAAQRTFAFLACEPRRSRLPLTASRLIGLIGCNPVTRHDAVVSVQAGFRGRELSALWPSAGWEMGERPAGLFSWLFAARWQTGEAPAAGRRDLGGVP